MSASVPTPRANPDLIGHAAAEAALLAAARSGRLPHAWLIGGPAGLGKATLAFRFARFLLSGGAKDTGGLFGDAVQDSLHVDPEDPVFRRVAAAGHADLLTVERPPPDDKGKQPREIPVDEIRKIAPFLRLTPAEGGWRVVVVDEAERMNRNSANALLKVLEEPPDRAVLLLACNRPGALLPTIRSRCRSLTLQPLAEDDLMALLARQAPDLPEEDARAAARLSRGCPGRALALVEEGGLTHYRNLIDLLETLPDLDMVAAHRMADKLAPPSAEQAYRTVSGLLETWLEGLIGALARGTAPPEIVAGDGALGQRLTAGRASLEPWLEVWEKTHRLFARADSANLDRKQVVLQAFMALEDAARA